MVEANSTCGICQVDGSAFSSPRMVEWYQLALKFRVQEDPNLEYLTKQYWPGCNQILVTNWRVDLRTWTIFFSKITLQVAIEFWYQFWSQLTQGCSIVQNDQIFHLIAPFRTFNSRLTSSSLPTPILMPSLHSIFTQDLKTSRNFHFPPKTLNMMSNSWTRPSISWDSFQSIVALNSFRLFRIENFQLN
jgi:hypothetical protein